MFYPVIKDPDPRNGVKLQQKLVIGLSIGTC